MIDFFPIKCRIQKARRNFIKYQEDLIKDQGFWDSIPGESRQPTIKVIPLLVLSVSTFGVDETKMMFHASAVTYATTDMC